jgi:hypothetical protein
LYGRIMCYDFMFGTSDFLKETILEESIYA